MERGVAGEALSSCPNFRRCRRSTSPKHVGALSGAVLEDWRPEDKTFWETTGRAIARRNLWISIPALLLAVRGLDGLVGGGREAAVGRLQVHHRPAVLAGGAAGPVRRDAADLLLLHGADLRRPALDHARDLVAADPGGRHRLRRAESDTPYFDLPGAGAAVRLRRRQFRLLDGQHLFFFPRAEKGNALALNAGLGNLGVSVVQFVVPIVITAGVFGWLGGDPQTVAKARRRIAVAAERRLHLGAVHRRLRVRGLVRHERHRLDAKASFADQAVIFQRKHNWIMCWLYTGTFGSFIGYSAGFPLLAKTQFPDGQRAAVRLPRAAGRRAVALGDGLDRRQIGRRRASPSGCSSLMMLGVLGILYFIGIKDQPGAFWGFFAMFMVLFFATGVGNASTFQMIPNIMRKEMPADADRRRPTAPAAGRKGIGRHHRLHLGDRRLRRLLHPEVLRHLDRADRRRRRARCGASSSST